MAEIGIGSTIWGYDWAAGRGHGKWTPYVITGQTRVSWEIDYDSWTRLKFQKKPDANGKYRTGALRRGYDTGMPILLTRQEVDDAEYCADHARRIAHCVEFCKDAAALRQIAALVGYTPEEQK
jgi:hypothetical protein